MKRAASCCQLPITEVGQTSRTGALSSDFSRHVEDQRQGLNRLAEPHVVGKAGAEAPAAQKPEPCISPLLVWPELTLEGTGHRQGLDGVPVLESGQDIGEPAPRLDAAGQPRSHRRPPHLPVHPGQCAAHHGP